ncbi:MAG: hypothetical protein S4CHLAM20_03450 [Chlamydiia bacterium]|nr:hypothetical protein [Chlamydiia bacterium]
MGNYLKSKIYEILENEKENLTKPVYSHLVAFFEANEVVYKEKDLDLEKGLYALKQYLKFVKEAIKSPTQFGNYHERETTPVDFFSLAHDLFSPFVDNDQSIIEGKENIEQITSLLKKGENVILLANHQTEGDPTFLEILLEPLFPGLIKNMISVAGARVTTDPIVIPFSRGLNAICVYSKKYFQMHEDRKQEMQRHNSASMLALRHLLDEGGKLVYVAPSGGRDRRNDNGDLLPASFNPDSIELMRIVGQKAKQETHYFPLAIYSYPILPPPEKIKKEIGEERKMCHSPVHVYFGKEYKMRAPNADEKADKQMFRKSQADAVHSVVVDLYKKVTKV